MNHLHAPCDTSLSALPNELLLHILFRLQTSDLLPLSALNHRFHSLVVRIVKQRLSAAASLCGHTLLLECFHPSARLTQPTLTCSYIGTNGLEDVNYDQDDESTSSPSEQLRNIRQLYSSYRPHRGIIERKFLRRHPAGDIPGSRTYTPPTNLQSQEQSSTTTPMLDQTPDHSANGLDLVPEPDPEPILQLVHLDSSELFSQLCAQTIVALAGPKPGIYRNPIDVSNGIIRVWRNWLAEQNEVNKTKEKAKESQPGRKYDSAYELQAEAYPGNINFPICGENLDQVLWVNDGQNVGLRFRVKQRTWRRDAPILMHAEEDVPVTYEIAYEEVVVRTMHLLVKMEQTMTEDYNVSRKAIVFGSFG